MADASAAGTSCCKSAAVSPCSRPVLIEAAPASGSVAHSLSMKLQAALPGHLASLLSSRSTGQAHRDRALSIEIASKANPHLATKGACRPLTDSRAARSKGLGRVAVQSRVRAHDSGNDASFPPGCDGLSAS